MKTLINTIRVLISAIYDLKRSINELTSTIAKPSDKNSFTVPNKSTYPHSQQTFTSTYSSEKHAVEKVIKAFTDKGINPKYHDKMSARLKKDWPVLHSALSELTAVKTNPTTKTSIWKYTDNA